MYSMKRARNEDEEELEELRNDYKVTLHDHTESLSRYSHSFCNRDHASYHSVPRLQQSTLTRSRNRLATSLSHCFSLQWIHLRMKMIHPTLLVRTRHQRRLLLALPRTLKINSRFAKIQTMTPIRTSRWQNLNQQRLPFGTGCSSHPQCHLIPPT